MVNFWCWVNVFANEVNSAKIGKRIKVKSQFNTSSKSGLDDFFRRNSEVRTNRLEKLDYEFQGSPEV